MRKFTLLLGLLLALVACTDESPEEIPDRAGIVLRFSPEESTAIDTRAATPEMATPDGKIQQVIVYAFSKESGKRVVKPFRQELEYPDNEIRMVLPDDSGDLVLHAVCNTDEAWYDGVDEITDLEDRCVKIEQAGDVFRGSLMMHGSLEIAQGDINAPGKIHKINVRRLGTHVYFNIRFLPEIADDKFYLSQVKAYNLPARSWLIGRDGSLVGNERYEYDSNDGDAVCIPGWKDEYLQDYRLPVQQEPMSGIYTTDFYQFENRRGGLDYSRDWFDEISDMNPDKKDLQQVFKGRYGDEKFPLGSYVCIEGTYISGGEVSDAKYKIYLGASNDRDFNIKRNSRYNYTVTIRACDNVDTRVTKTPLTEAQITPAFSTPLDAHCNAARCLANTTGAWELYVENPDECPWLEISLSPRYKPLALGGTSDGTCAVTRLSGDEPLVDYFYIHTDEYVPEKEKEFHNSQDPSTWRHGWVVLRDKVNDTEARLEITQRPAQLVKLEVKDDPIYGTFTHEFYVEHTLEEKYLQWGFLKYPANPIMTSMINDRWDGLANTRRLYDEAVKKNGMYNPDGEDPSLITVPEHIALGYAVAKNRDRNGNGRIDYEEIVWYVPALNELAELRRVMNEHYLEFENPQDKFWSSTPYLAGYTDVIPGRAFYVKMGKGQTVGEKAFAMRNRNYNVICCRRKGAWKGDHESGSGGDLDIDDKWEEEEDIMPIK